MDFEFTDDQLELRDAARDVLAKACPPAVVRAVYEGGGAVQGGVDRGGVEQGAGAVGSGLWRTLCELDWPGLAIAEEHGGLGLGFVEAGIIAEELGRVVAPVPYLSTVLQYGAVARLAGDDERLVAVASGARTGALAMAEGGRWEPDAVQTAAVPTDGQGDGDSGGAWVLSGTKSHVLDGATADEVLVVARGEVGPGGSALGVFAVAPDAPGVTVTPVDSIDPTQPVAHLTFDGVEVRSDAVLVAPGDPAVDDVLARAFDESTVAVALSTVAACRTIFEMTVQYAKDREQFGRRIGSFQAVKHRLADCFLAVERASALAWFAALTIAEDDPRRSLATSMAKSAAGDCVRLLSKDGLQLHGGVGFTWEHDLHFWLKRAVAGELLFGTSAWHRSRVADLLGLAS